VLVEIEDRLEGLGQVYHKGYVKHSQESLLYSNWSLHQSSTKIFAGYRFENGGEQSSIEFTYVRYADSCGCFETFI
jgi:hypothetical protein